MKFEHFALNVPDAAAMARWYVQHCRMRVVRSIPKAPHTHFLADEGGRVMMEIYTNPEAPTPDYASMPPLCFHFALAVQDAEPPKKRLLAAGATVFQDQVLDDGSRIVTLRDPWGVPLQLCQRVEPMA